MDARRRPGPKGHLCQFVQRRAAPAGHGGVGGLLPPISCSNDLTGRDPVTPGERAAARSATRLAPADHQPEASMWLDMHLHVFEQSIPASASADGAGERLVGCRRGTIGRAGGIAVGWLCPCPWSAMIPIVTRGVPQLVAGCAAAQSDCVSGLIPGFLLVMPSAAQKVL
jgi:hypothetical protein